MVEDTTSTVDKRGQGLCGRGVSGSRLRDAGITETEVPSDPSRVLLRSMHEPLSVRGSQLISSTSVSSSSTETPLDLKRGLSGLS